MIISGYQNSFASFMMVIVHCAIIALLLVATPSVQSAASEALLPFNHSTQSYGTQQETPQFTDLPQELIEKTGYSLNYFDIRSLRLSSSQMLNNQRLLFIENRSYQAYCSFLKQSFSVLLNQTR
eukprot:538499_1